MGMAVFGLIAIAASAASELSIVYLSPVGSQGQIYAVEFAHFGDEIGVSCVVDGFAFGSY